jgi:hypothetical protein
MVMANKETSKNIENFWPAWVALLIWDPERWNWFSDRKVARQRKLYYRARGVVVYDRALNGKFEV